MAKQRKWTQAILRCLCYSRCWVEPSGVCSAAPPNRALSSRLGVLLYSLMSGALPFPEHEDVLGAPGVDQGALPTEQELEFGRSFRSRGSAVQLSPVPSLFGMDLTSPFYSTTPRIDMLLERLKRRQQFQVPPWCSPECTDLLLKLLQVGNACCFALTALCVRDLLLVSYRPDPPVVSAVQAAHRRRAAPASIHTVPQVGGAAAKRGAAVLCCTPVLRR